MRFSTVLLFLTAALAVVSMGCQGPTPDPSCQSGTGQLVFTNSSTEPMSIVVTDDQGALAPIVVAGNGARLSEDTPLGRVRVQATGDVSGALYLDAFYTVKCDSNTFVNISGTVQFGLDVTAAGTGTGVVSSQPAGISCGFNCSAQFGAATVVTLKAQAAGNSVFDGWSGDCTGSSVTCKVTMERAAQVTATFTKVNDNPTYPAAHPALPQLLNHGGRVLTNAVFTSVTFPDDALAAQLDDFVSKVGATQYWLDAVGEYGVGPATARAAAHLSEAAPASISDTGIQTWLKGKLDGTHPEFGTPTNNSLYVLYYPSTTKVTLDGLTSCTDFDGYHFNTKLANGQLVSYAVIVRCSTGATALDDLTSTTSHEMMEAATDAIPYDNTGFEGVAQDNEIWESMSFGSEDGDMCQRYSTSFFKPAGLGYEVARGWSNAAAAASHDPCQPSTATYFNSAPVVSDTVSYLDGGFSETSKGVNIPVGTSATVLVNLFSDSPTSGPWQVSALEDSTTSHLSFSWDRTTGQNGDVLQLTIHVNSSDATHNAEYVWIKSSLNGVAHYWPLVVGNPAAATTGQSKPLSTSTRAATLDSSQRPRVSRLKHTAF